MVTHKLSVYQYLTEEEIFHTIYSLPDDVTSSDFDDDHSATSLDFSSSLEWSGSPRFLLGHVSQQWNLLEIQIVTTFCIDLSTLAI